ncbi:MAG: sulfotransferase domain-containing protein [Pseudomonadota bacterium]
MTMGQGVSLPDFLIIGAMKCGTTTLAEQLGLQPGIFMATPKEPNFFSDDDVYARGMDWYQHLFATAAEGDLCGEASTHYTKLPNHPETLARMRPVLSAPRIVYSVRDPIERALSHFMHDWLEGKMPKDPEAAFRTHPELVDYGRYAMQIAPFIEAYGREAVLLTSLERMKTAPDAELRRICAHLGLAASPAWHADLTARNVSAERFRKGPRWLFRLLVANPVASWLRQTLVPKSVRRRIREARQIGERPELSEALVAQLRARFAPDLAELRALFPDVVLGFEARFEMEIVS